MRIKFVYVIICNEQNYYAEQLWASIYSLKEWNSGAYVEIITDLDTYQYLSKHYPNLLMLINHIVISKVPTEYPLAARSRYLKTSIRNIIEGDFLFLDTDTIICGDLSELDKCDKDISCVKDLHTDFSHNPYYNLNVKLVMDAFDTDVSNAINYFNSGVMLVKDNAITREFYNAWHKNWLSAYMKKSLKTDQQSLLKTDFDFGRLINPLKDIYNCQISMSIKYLDQAKIMHFFNNLVLDRGGTISPFLNGDFFKKLRQEKHISEELLFLILNCKNSFDSITPIMGHKEFMFLCSPLGANFMNIMMKNNHLYRCLNSIAESLNHIKKLIK